MVLSVYMLFWLGVAIAAFIALSLLKRKREPSARVIVCPKAGMPAKVEIDGRHAFWSTLKGIRELRLRACSRWPAFAGCEQDCLAQIEPESQVERMIATWYAGKKCASCSVSLDCMDWQRGRAAAFDENRRLLELRDMNWTNFPMVLDRYQPICFKCHEVELARRRAASA